MRLRNHHDPKHSEGFNFVGLLARQQNLFIPLPFLRWSFKEILVDIGNVKLSSCQGGPYLVETLQIDFAGVTNTERRLVLTSRQTRKCVAPYSRCLFSDDCLAVHRRSGLQCALFICATRIWTRFWMRIVGFPSLLMGCFDKTQEFSSPSTCSGGG